ncbi:PAPA-1-like conserved region-domain-containing protein [Thelonectria olida]|uniref:PAPA-1-like conserved region-domain-containing protein n=1 Tax=Thelonectria olida TaxID=1576542 RepID=A0A9P9AKG6_9HYPO|nr:PAPA-1-like conserved region-domain-containing protein [Thelonectria olida]
MSSRPRRSAAARANKVISVHARWADSPERGERSAMSSRRSGRASRDAPASPSPDDRSLTVKVSNPSRSSIRNGRTFAGGEIVEGKRNRGTRKSYVVDSSPEEDDDEEEEEEEIEVEDEEDDDDELDEDAEGEEMDVDAEGEDAEGDIDMDMLPPAPVIKVSKPPKSKPVPRPASKVVPEDDDDDDDDELSDPADSDLGDQTMGMDDTMLDEDAEGEEIEVVGEDVEEEEAEPADSDDEGSQDGEVDLSKMTKRQRARFEDEPQQYMKLSDEVQAKKVFTAEELSMRRQEMARRRRNLSEKRNEEVKMETINKLLKKQAPKISRKGGAGGETNDESSKPNPIFVRWVSNKSGIRVGVPEEMVESPSGAVFRRGGPGLSSGKMVEEVA